MLTNEGTQFSRVATTNSSGQYVASSVPSGAYRITVEHPGFQKMIRSGIRLTAADTLTVDLQLTVGSVQESIEVKETVPLLQSQTAAVSSLVSNQQIMEMPLNGRTFTQLLRLSVGAYTGSSNNLSDSPYAMRGDNNISVNGSSAQNNSYLIDGMFNRNLWLSTLVMVPTIDSIQEIRLLTSNYSAEYGVAAGALTVVQTKSGSNAFHGSAYEFLRNNKLDANTFFNNRAGVPRPAFRRNEFGGTFGGPVRRDRTFFFADYQGIRIREPRSITSTVPTLAQRAMVATGDFGGLGASIYDPYTLMSGPEGSPLRTAFPGNRIPASRLDPAAVKLFALLPAPISAASSRNFVFTPGAKQRTDQFDVRLDQSIGQSDRLFFKYSYDNTDLESPGVLPAPANPGVPMGKYLTAFGLNSATEVPLKNWSVTLNLAAFVDDSWRVNNRLTLNVGARYEVHAPPYDVYDRWSNFDVGTGQLVLAGRDGNSRRLRNFDNNNIAPRVGITYMLTSDRKTVLRTGFGMSFVEAGQGGGQLYKNLPFFFSQVVATDQDGRPPMRVSDGLPTPVAPSLTDRDELSSGNPNAWDMDLKTTQAMQWSFGVQRELIPDLLLDVSYVGTRTLRLISNVNLNQSFPGPGAQGLRRPFYSINPRVTNVTYRTNYGSAKYHSMQVRLEKRASKGLTASLAYTWSHYMANAAHVNGNGNGPPQDARCYGCEWGSMPEDRRHVAVVNRVYELPLGPGRDYLKQGLLAHVVGNWNVSGIWTMSTGEHFTPGLAAAVSNSVGGGDRPNRIRDGNLPADQRSIDRWFDLAAFTSPAQFTFGNAGRGILEGPGNFNLDLGVHRNFALREGWKLAFRWEMFNAMNRANFSVPNAAIGSPVAGQISGTAPARIMQMALKLTF